LKRFEIRPGDVLVNWVPLYHGLGLVRFIFCPLFFGCPVHFVQPTIAHLQTWLKTIARVRGTITGAPDFAFRAANEIVNPDGLDLSSLRFAISSGEAIRFETIQRFEKKFGLPGVIRPVYGLSESNGVTGVAPGEPLRTDAAGNVCCGKPVHGMELEVVDENGIAQPAGKPGEIRLRGPQVFTGFENEEATRKKLRDGWLYTGDMGTRDGEGNLYVVGRVRSLIKRGGAMLAPRDVELPAERVAGVVGSAAFGVVRNALLGSEDVILAAEIGEKEIASEIERARIAREITEQISHALGFGPTEIVLVPAQKIPRTSNGKVRHEEVKRLFSAGDFTRSEAFVFGRGSAG
jgi:acyl-CoA synthetase (AMP-forming)/AMP-acid ligase II